jgi:hypothetical protein
MATKKSASKKSVSKKAAGKKSSQSMATTKKSAAKKSRPNKTKAKVKKAVLKIIMPTDIPDAVNCMCMQKRPNGKFYNFRLQEGRWVQASAIPFPTKEICEDACC